MVGDKLSERKRTVRRNTEKTHSIMKSDRDKDKEI